MPMSRLEAERTLSSVVLAVTVGNDIGEALSRAILRDTYLSPTEESVANLAFLEVEGELSARRLLTKAR